MSATTVKANRARRGLLASIAIGLLVLATCSSGSSKRAPGGEGGSHPTGSSGVTTVQVSTVGGKFVLTNAQGDTLYLTDQEMEGKPLCTSSACTAIWIPLTLPAGQEASGPPQTTAALGTATRPDGTKQVTLNGKPLYTFSLDHSRGQANGDGAKDRFDGTNFSWHIATTVASVGPASPAQSSAASSSGGGYRY